MWQTLCTCVDTTLSRYDDWTMNWCWLAHCPDCGDAVLPLGSSDTRTPVDSQHASVWSRFPHYCRVAQKMTYIELGDIVSCDVMLRNMGFHGEVGPATISRDQAACVRLHVLRSINAVVQDYARAVGRLPGVDQVPRCWFPVFRDTFDDRQGVVLVPVCESADHVHPVRTSNGSDTVALSFDEVRQCSQYLWRVACMVEAAALSVGDGVSTADREKYAGVRKRMYGIMTSSSSHNATWPGRSRRLRDGFRFRHTSQPAPLRKAVVNQGHSPGGCTWVCKLVCGQAYHHPVPQPPTRFVRRLALVIGVSKYAGALPPLPNSTSSADSMARMLKEELGFRQEYDAPCVASLAGLDGHAAPWLDKNVHVITDDGATGGVSLQQLNGAVEGLKKAAQAACEQADAASGQAKSKDSSVAVEADTPGCLVLVFVSGHGQQCGGRHYLLPSHSTGIKAPATPAECIQTALDIDKIPADLDDDGSRRHAFIGLADMCREIVAAKEVPEPCQVFCDTFVMRACDTGTKAFAGDEATTTHTQCVATVGGGGVPCSQ